MSDREHNLASFRMMTEFWFPERRARGKTYKFTDRQIEIALMVLNKEK